MSLLEYGDPGIYEQVQQGRAAESVKWVHPDERLNPVVGALKIVNWFEFDSLANLEAAAADPAKFRAGYMGSQYIPRPDFAALLAAAKESLPRNIAHHKAQLCKAIAWEMKTYGSILMPDPNAPQPAPPDPDAAYRQHVRRNRPRRRREVSA
jgi:hypothetical protein